VPSWGRQDRRFHRCADDLGSSRVRVLAVARRPVHVFGAVAHPGRRVEEGLPALASELFQLPVDGAGRARL